MSHSRMPSVWGIRCFKWVNPFTRLLKGSVTAERPRTLRRLRNVYGQTPCGMGTGADCAVERLDDGGGRNDGGFRHNERERDRDDKSLSIMSPFDEQEEWAKISEIMASFGTGLVRESVFVTELEQEFQSRLGFTTESLNSPSIPTHIGQWLSNLNLSDYESLFVNYGYDDLEFINGILEENDLKEMGITSDQDRLTIMNSSVTLNKRVDKRSGSQAKTVDEWLKAIHLDNYNETFKKHLYTDMERVKRVWEVELSAVLEIQKPGHRKRILASVTGPSPRGQQRNGGGPNLEDLNKDLNTLKSNIQQLKEEIREKLPETPQDNGHSQITIIGTNAATSGTLRHRKNRPAPQPPQRPNSHNGITTAPEKLEIRAPSELLFGVPSTLKTQWRHQPKTLVTGTVTYAANYLGSTVVKELRGTESTKKSIQKLKKTCRDPRVSLEITLAISYRGVRFLETATSEPICDHEIRNIHCACQDADDLTHFAYITKDHTSRTHFCHVFCVPTMDQATEVILTLGQAFEVAYQMALRDKIGGQTVRSQSANQLASLASGNTINSTINNTKTNSTTDTNTIDINSSTNENSQNTGTLKSKLKTKTSGNGNANNTLTKNSTNTLTKNSTNLTNTLTKNSTNLSNTLTKNSTNKNTSTKNSINPNNISSGNVNTSTVINSHRITTTSNCSTSGNSSTSTKPLVTHGRSHSVNDIKINGNQLKLVPTPVDDIGVGVKDMKAGSRAPIALSEEL